MLGFIVGPALQAFVTPFGEHGVQLIPGLITLNMYTAAGWINVFMAVGNFCVFLPFIFKVSIVVGFSNSCNIKNNNTGRTRKNKVFNYLRFFVVAILVDIV